VLSGGQKDKAIPQEVRIQFVVGAFVTVLTWWLERRPRLTSSQVDTTFRRLVLNGSDRRVAAYLIVRCSPTFDAYQSQRLHQIPPDQLVPPQRTRVEGYRIRLLRVDMPRRAPIADLPGASPEPPFAQRLESTLLRRSQSAIMRIHLERSHSLAGAIGAGRSHISLRK
jgi:hypothetical protein